MLSWLQIISLAVIQGLTEFLPISSSAHLILPSQLLGWPDQGLAFDVAVHVGTLSAIVWYFRWEIIELAQAWLRSCMGQQSQQGWLAWGVALGTVPAVIAGLLLDDLIEQHLRSILVIAATTIFFGLLLQWGDMRSSRSRTLTQLGLKDALLIGLAQAIALIPGTSRSGITMTAAQFLGFERQAAARFSFLLSIPLISAAGAYKALELLQSTTSVYWSELLAGIILSALSAYICIRLFLGWLDRIGMLPFVIYRLVLGVVLLVIAFGT
ncbi:undecaprenyl-diphosphate phosphatase [Balneatrix alpica]|uniref:undecaprenyl-diphosphate phosphatase n=1 Tax=Balneatrix alpica TaxID=75684 RepID=UPI0027383E0D|nr:undecaprenyl-diphosphate phosphatase [Balneatrix alpica]